ncbi:MULTISPECIES: IclR family transcriptional regulator [unclassified Bordetella]|uniref:IclR family transcriptional regulator n=1 Tax=unclassified Bordetella TaxID=2630031 RepID=UPI00132AE76B|nr:MULTISPECIES: IclR family transcriptional regulator C-terminal domain-containing protein [unclassified Bordetella]MVW70323.1 helix-turn-helix domain-containing protein [Bordetella sp. 15P40C-2]MVW78098.1 helix-turn-helix domain-containing protein [Bordetella sp. 02P26C-1]
MALDDSHPDFVSALARGISVLLAFTSNTPEMTLSEVAAKTGLTAATVRRSLLTLMALGYVKQNGRRFVLTARVLQLGAAFVESMNLNQVAQIYLQDIVDVFHDASSLTVLDGNDVVYVVHIPSNRPARLRQHVGARMPAHGASTGYVLLGHLPDEELEAYLSGAPFPAFTDKTPVTRDEVRALCMAARENGYAIAEDAIGLGTIAIAVPIRDQQGRVVAAINCSADSTKVTRDKLIETRLEPLQRAAQHISEQLIRYPALTVSVLG